MQKKIYSSLEETPEKGGNRQVRMACLWATEGLFAYAETGKNPPQQVIGAESTDKLTQKVLGFAKFSVSSSPAPANVSCTAHARGKHWHGAVLQDDACGQLKLLSEVCSWPCRPLDGLAAVPGLALKLTWPSSLTSRASH